MQKLVWQNSNGDEINLTSGNYGITEWEGFSNASLNIQSQQVPFQDGGVFLDALIEQRELSVTLKMQDNGNLEERYRMRRELVHILNPKLGEGYLIYTNDFISKRIKCVAQVPLFPTHNSNDSGTPSASLAWTACEPYWEDLEETSITISDNSVVEIEYEGDEETSIRADIYGSTQNPTIRNQTTGKKIEIKGNYQNPLEINTQIGKKYVYDAVLDFKWQSGGSLSCCYKNAKVTIMAGRIMLVINEDGEIVKPTLPLNMGDKQFWSIIEVGNGKYLATTTLDLISSDNGYDWTLLSKSISFRYIYYSDGLCIGVGGYAYIYTSTDNGISWQSHPTYHTSSNYSLYAVCKCNGFFIAVGNAGTMMKSVDGSEWNDISSPTGRKLNAIAYGNGKIVIVGSNGFVSVSGDDGATWSDKNIGTYSELYNVYYDKELNKFFICVNSFIADSEDGEIWNITNVYGNVRAVCGYKNSYIAVGDSTVLTSNNANSWKVLSLSAILYSDMIKVDNKLYALIPNYKITTSVDGVNWETFDILVSGTRILYTINNFLIMGAHSIYKSADGVSNYNSVYTNNKELNAIAYGNGKVIVGGTNGLIVLSDDNGETWSEITTSASSSCMDVIFANNNFYIFYVNGDIYKSSDGINWSNISNHSIRYVRNIVYGDGVFVGFGSDSQRNAVLLRSKDCINWETQPCSYTAWSVKYVNQQFFIGTTNGVILGSYTGIDWVTYELEKNALMEINGVIIINGKYLAYGSTLYFSELKLVNNLINNLSEDSDITLILKSGKNNLTFTSNSSNGQSSFAKIFYRQKYIGV